MSSTLPLSAAVVQSFRPTKTFGYHQLASITLLDFDDSGQFLISAGVDKSIQLYDIHKGVHLKDIQSQKYGAHLAKFTHLDKNCLYALTPVGAGGDGVDHSIRYLLLDDNRYLRYFKGHKEQVVSLEVDPVHDVFLSASRDLTAKLWDLRLAAPAGSVETGTAAVVAFDPRGVVFVVAKGASATVEFYDVANLDRGPFATLQVATLDKGAWTKAEFSNNALWVLLSTEGDHHYVLDAFTGALRAVLAVPHGAIALKYPANGALTFTPCGRFALVGSAHHLVHVFDLAPLELRADPLPAHLHPLRRLDSDQGIPKIVLFNPKLLTFASADTTVSLWQPLIES